MTHLKFNRKQRNQILRFAQIFHCKERVDLMEVFYLSDSSGDAYLKLVPPCA